MATRGSADVLHIWLTPSSRLMYVVTLCLIIYLSFFLREHGNSRKATVTEQQVGRRNTVRRVFNAKRAPLPI